MSTIDPIEVIFSISEVQSLNFVQWSSPPPSSSRRCSCRWPSWAGSLVSYIASSPSRCPYRSCCRRWVQAEPGFRQSPEDISQLYVRNREGQMVPLDTLTMLQRITGPDIIQRYNVLRSAEISGAAAAGYSSGQAIAAMQEVAATVLPEGFSYGWTGTAFQEIQAGKAQASIFVLAFVLVFSSPGKSEEAEPEAPPADEPVGHSGGQTPLGGEEQP